jgi:GT2 family glycosyltransferase
MSNCVNTGKDHALVVLPTLGLNLEYLEACITSIVHCGIPTCVMVIDSSQGGINLELDLRGLKIQRSGAYGLSAAINLGVASSNCDAEFVTWIGDDDLYELNGLRTLYDLLKLNPDATFTTGACRYIDSAGKEIQILRPSYLQSFITKYLTTSVAQPATLVRRSAWDLVGGLDESLRFAMDLDLWLKLWTLGNSRSTRKVCASYRWHKTSLSSSSEKRAATEALIIRKSRFGRLRTVPAQLITAAFYARIKFSRSKLNSL